MKRILIIEDDESIAAIERDYLVLSEFEVDIAATGRDGIAMGRSGRYDLILLDLMLPGMAGADVCREIRRSSNAPILMVTAKSGEDDIVAGLDAGADDYIVKPFSPKILMARVRANLRKNGAAEGGGSDVITVGGSLVIDPQNFTVKKNGEEVSLTRNEFMILSKMAARPEKTWSRDDLITYALGYEYDGFERSIDSYIKNIRKKLYDPEHENGYIRTVHGFGYKISE